MFRGEEEKFKALFEFSKETEEEEEEEEKNNNSGHQVIAP